MRRSSTRSALSAIGAIWRAFAGRQWQACGCLDAKRLETVLTDRQQGKLGPTVKLITNDILRVFKVIMTVPPVADDDLR